MRGPFFIAHRPPTFFLGFNLISTWHISTTWLEEPDVLRLHETTSTCCSFYWTRHRTSKLRYVWGWCWSSDVSPKKYGLGLGKIHPHKWLCFEDLGSRRACFAWKTKNETHTLVEALVEMISWYSLYLHVFIFTHFLVTFVHVVFLLKLSQLSTFTIFGNSLDCVCAWKTEVVAEDLQGRHTWKPSL